MGLVLVIATGFLTAAAFYTLDFFIFFCIFELLLLPMFFLFTRVTSRNRSKKAVLYFYLYTVIGSLLLLFSILLIFSQTGTTNYLYLMEYFFDLDHQVVLLLLGFVGFATKLPIFPMHIWLTEAHVEAPTVGSVILAALFLKLGCYGLLRFTLNLFPSVAWYFSPLFLFIAFYSALSASLGALRQVDMKKIIAYASINHMGLVLAGLVTTKIYATLGSLHLMVSHGFISAGLFFCVGALYERLHSKSLLGISGLLSFTPQLIVFFFLFIQGNISIPGTWAFVSESLILFGIFYSSFTAMVLFKLPIYLNTLYSLILVGKASFGGSFFLGDINLRSRVVRLWDLNLREYLVLLSLFSFVIMLGYFPGPLTEILYMTLKTGIII